MKKQKISHNFCVEHCVFASSRQPIKTNRKASRLSFTIFVQQVNWSHQRNFHTVKITDVYVKFRIDIQTIRLILARERIKYENETLNISRGWEIVVCSLSTPLLFLPNKSLASSLIILTNAIEQSCQLIWGRRKIDPSPRFQNDFLQRSCSLYLELYLNEDIISKDNCAVIDYPRCYTCNWILWERS